MNHNKIWEITAHILNNPGKGIKVTEVARELGVSKASVSLTIKRLVEEGLVRDWRVDMDNPLTRASKIMINVEKIKSSGLIDKVKPHALGIGLYGSWAKGANTEDSDVDIWVKPKKSFKLANSVISGEVRERLGTDVDLLVLGKERLEQIKESNKIFFYTLKFSTMNLFGENIE